MARTKDRSEVERVLGDPVFPDFSENILRSHRIVMPGFVPGIHDFKAEKSKDVDGRDKPGHDEEWRRRNCGLLRETRIGVKISSPRHRDVAGLAGDAECIPAPPLAGRGYSRKDGDIEKALSGSSGHCSRF